MRILSSTIIFMILISGCTSLSKQAGTPAKTADVPSDAHLTIQANRASTAPTLDGKLDEACWENAQKATNFLTMNSDRPATNKTIGSVCYDDTHLYIGVKCFLPEGEKPKGKKREHDIYLFSDDLVEIMIDPGRTQEDYFQLVTNAFGQTFDGKRTQRGSSFDKAWDGGWRSSAHIADGYFSIEMAVPFHNLGITNTTGSTWGINICRSAKVPTNEHASIAQMGLYNHAHRFAALSGLNVDFNKYLLPISKTQAHWVDSNTAMISATVTNQTGETRQVNVQVGDTTTPMTLLANQTVQIPIGKTAIQQLDETRSDLYFVKEDPPARNLIVKDAGNGTILTSSVITRPWFCEAMWIDVNDPWQRDMTGKKTQAINMTIRTQIKAAGKLSVAIRSRATGNVVATKTVDSPGSETQLSFDAKGWAWGAYDVEASFNDAVKSQTQATVLPGGKHRIVVLNNFVSELMDTKKRGFLGQSEIAFMNPRAGWVYIESPGGKVRINDEKTALPSEEAMRFLPAGRHTLYTEHPAQQLIVRSVPYLIHSSDPILFGPKVSGEIWRNTNVMLIGGGKSIKATEVWAKDGKYRTAFAIAPSHDLGGDGFVDAQAYYGQMLKHLGFSHEGFQGVMADQISSATPLQKMHIAMTMARIAANPKLKGRSWSSWHEGQPAGSSADRALMRVALDEDWPYSFYRYLSEPLTQEQAHEMVRDQIIQGILACKAQYPEAIKKLVLTLGYLSHSPGGISQNIRPDRNFRVMMEMQVNAMAKHRDVFGLYGLSWYYSPYVDKENAKWAVRLFRHYAIEGKTDMLSSDPYVLTHLVNPDFEDGGNGWTVTEADADSVRTEHVAGFGVLEGRYLGGTLGENVIVTKRSSKAPNQFSQTIKNLKPGRVYGLKMISADYQNMLSAVSEKRLDAIRVQIDNVDLVLGEDQNTHWAWSHRMNALGFNEKEKKLAWLNFHWYVFRAKADTAQLTVSDWASDSDPGGEIGREVMFNFIEVQPYLD